MRRWNTSVTLSSHKFFVSQNFVGSIKCRVCNWKWADTNWNDFSGRAREKIHINSFHDLCNGKNAQSSTVDEVRVLSLSQKKDIWVFFTRNFSLQLLRSPDLLNRIQFLLRCVTAGDFVLWETNKQIGRSHISLRFISALVRRLGGPWKRCVLLPRCAYWLEDVSAKEFKQIGVRWRKGRQLFGRDNEGWGESEIKIDFGTIWNMEFYGMVWNNKILGNGIEYERSRNKVEYEISIITS